MIVTIVKTFEIYFVEVEPWAQIFEDLRSAVAVGDEAGDESGGFGFFENGYGPLAGDQRLVVGADQNFCALGDGIAAPDVRARLDAEAQTALGSRRACDVTQFWQ